MADKKNNNNENKDEKQKSLTGRLLSIQNIIILIVILLGIGAGYGIGNIFADIKTSEQQNSTIETGRDNSRGESEKASGDPWYYELPPVIANLNVPEVSRYVRAVITLEISSVLDEETGRKMLDAKQPILINWLTIYLSSLALDDVTGDKNLRRIQAQISDALNEELFPDSKPKIKKILLKEFAVQ